MLEAIRTATREDFDAVWSFYGEVCAANAFEEYGPVWHFGIYPSAEDIREHIEAGELEIGLADDCIVSAMVITDREDEIYRDVPWHIASKPEQTAALHLFAVLPEYRGKGVSAEMLRALFGRCARRGKRVIHLDVVKGNLPAEKLYRRAGFRFVCEMEVFYPDTGNLTVELYELELTERERENA